MSESSMMVVVNHEEQYSVWPVTRALPKGWSEVVRYETEEECLQYIEAVWTDIRPLSIRSPKTDEVML